MNPNLLYSQAVQGSSTGRSYGIIDTLHLVEVARAASFLTSGMLTAQDAAAVKSWFASYLDWLSHSERGMKERDTTNNHAFCWALQAAEFACLAGAMLVRHHFLKGWKGTSHRHPHEQLLKRRRPWDVRTHSTIPQEVLAERGSGVIVVCSSY